MRLVLRYRLVVCLFVLLLWNLVPPVLAQETDPSLNLTVAAEDTPLVIQGLLDGQANSFSGNVRLTVTGGDATDLRLLASELQHDSQSSLRVDRSYVTIPAGINLNAGQPRDVRVTINNLSRPGVYTGILKFLLPGQAEAEALVVPLELHLDAVPKVLPVTPILSWQVVRCDHWLDCRLATWLLPQSVVQEKWEVWLDNQTANSVEVVDGVAVLFGTKSGNTVRATDVILAMPHTLPASQVDPIAVIINRQRLAPDSYQGTLRFKLAGVNEPVLVTTSIDVRQGPFWALVVVLLGILLGRLVRDMDTQAVQTQIKLMPVYLRLHADANNLNVATDRADAMTQLESFKQRLEEKKETEEALLSTLEIIEAHIRFYISLEALEADLPDNLRNRLVPQFAAARQAVRDGRPIEAEQHYSEIKQTVDEATKDGFLGVSEQAKEFGNQMIALGESLRRLGTAVQVKTSSRWLQLLAWLSGIRLSADVRFWVVRPILSLVLLILLVLWGMQALYVNSGASFGANGIYDYMGLLLWGLTSDVVSRSLSNMPMKME